MRKRTQATNTKILAPLVNSSSHPKRSHEGTEKRTLRALALGAVAAKEAQRRKYVIALYQELILRAFPGLGRARPGTIDDEPEKALRTVGISVDYVRTLGGGGGQPLYEGMMEAERAAREGRIDVLLVGMTDGYTIAGRAGAAVSKIELTPDELRAQFETLATRYAWPGWKEVWDELLRDPPPTSPPTLP